MFSQSPLSTVKDLCSELCDVIYRGALCHHSVVHVLDRAYLLDVWPSAGDTVVTESALGPPLTRQLGKQTHSQTVTFESSQLQEGKIAPMDVQKTGLAHFGRLCQGGLHRGSHMAGASWGLEGILQAEAQEEVRSRVRCVGGMESGHQCRDRKLRPRECGCKE